MAPVSHGSEKVPWLPWALAIGSSALRSGNDHRFGHLILPHQYKYKVGLLPPYIPVTEVKADNAGAGALTAPVTTLRPVYR
jgi:hypothetical protein